MKNKTLYFSLEKLWPEGMSANSALSKYRHLGLTWIALKKAKSGQLSRVSPKSAKGLLAIAHDWAENTDSLSIDLILDESGECFSLRKLWPEEASVHSIYLEYGEPLGLTRDTLTKAKAGCLARVGARPLKGLLAIAEKWSGATQSCDLDLIIVEQTA